MTTEDKARTMAQALRAYRLHGEGVSMTQEELAVRSGIGLTSLKRFERTGGITLRNFLALVTALGRDTEMQLVIPEVPLTSRKRARQQPRVTA